MKKYLINKLYGDNYCALITLLDFETKISDCLKLINISSCDNQKLLVDTALCSGMNKYRFIETILDNEGAINISDYKYVEVDSVMMEKANQILIQEQACLNNSILTIPQINILNKLN
ncbi:MAG: type II toxin-antitoxin system RnlB family antitoxin [Tissierellia bacterium]|nr:type II toxin-antitoxin system RnlB family antitoxin [Tissierellia bacterium]